MSTENPQGRNPEPQSFAKAVAYTAKGLFSKDAPTRRSSALFYLALAGILLTLWFALGLFSSNESDPLGDDDVVVSEQVDEADEATQGENLNKFFAKTQQEAQSFYTTLEIGKFTLQLKSEPKLKAKAAAGVLHLGEVEITVECETKAVCQLIEDNILKARDSISESLVVVDQQELMTKEGKTRLKDMIVQALNRWLRTMTESDKKGVRTVYFTKLVIG